MTNLSHIFPSDYINPPTEEDIQLEVQDMLCHTDYPIKLLSTIAQHPCPFYREALMVCLEQQWSEMVNIQHHLTGYYDGDGRWIIYWPDAESEMKRMIKRFRNEQYVIKEQQKPTHPPSTQRDKTSHDIIHQITSAIQQEISNFTTYNNITTTPNIIIQNLNIYTFNAPTGQFVNHQNVENLNS